MIGMSDTAIENRILVIRGVRVMVDADLGELYGVPTKALNQAVKRNLNRFPSDFMFRLNATEKEEVVANCDHLAGLKYSKSLPFACTEHGAIMAASVLNSPRAVEMSVFIVRAFVKLREILPSIQCLAGARHHSGNNPGKTIIAPRVARPGGDAV